MTGAEIIAHCEHIITSNQWQRLGGTAIHPPTAKLILRVFKKLSARNQIVFMTFTPTQMAIQASKIVNRYKHRAP